MRNMIFVLLVGLLVVPADAGASVRIEGDFVATKACQAYQSMRKKTNPGKVELTIGEHYTLKEANVPDGATWYRVLVTTANPKERWVYFECGEAAISGNGGNGGGNSGGNSQDDHDCNTPDEADAYVFAVSWQPAFCEGHRDKPECQVTDPESYQATHFTLHGLWPNKSSCGTHYGYCGQYRQQVRPFCDYDTVPMSAGMLRQLGVMMPSAAHGSCLQRHEWYKHGTCQSQWDADDYYFEAMKLLIEFNGGNTNGLAAFMAEHLGQRVDIDTLNERIDQQFGEGAHKRMQYGCTGGRLVDIYVSLPAKLENMSLATLIQQAPEKYGNKCGSSFVVDRIDD